VGWEVDGNVLGSRPMVGFGISGVEHSNSAAITLALSVRRLRLMPGNSVS
jgi:hypothetical protein